MTLAPRHLRSLKPLVVIMLGLIGLGMCYDQTYPNCIADAWHGPCVRIPTGGSYSITTTDSCTTMFCAPYGETSDTCSDPTIVNCTVPCYVVICSDDDCVDVVEVRAGQYSRNCIQSYVTDDFCPEQ